MILCPLKTLFKNVATGGLSAHAVSYELKHSLHLPNTGQVTCFCPTEGPLPVWGMGQLTSLLLKAKVHRELSKFIRETKNPNHRPVDEEMSFVLKKNTILIKA